MIEKLKANKKKLLLGGAITLGAIALVVGVILIVRAANQAKVEVYPVERIREYSWADQQGSYGTIMAGNVQNVYLDSSLLVSKIHVEQGQRVSVGDTLLSYDMTVLALDVESKEINISIAENKITKANNELAALKALTPSSPPAAFDVLRTDLSALAQVNGGGDGLNKDTPLVFNLSYSAFFAGQKVTAAFLQEILDNNTFVRLVLVSDNYTKIGYWDLSAESVAKTSPVGEWNPTNGINIDGSGGVNAAGAPAPYGPFTLMNQNAIGGPYYTQQEIDRMIADKEGEIRELDIDLKQARLDYEQAKSALSEGSVTAQIDGVVSLVESPDTVESGKPIIVVQSGDGYSAVGAVSELNLNNIAVGQQVYIQSWSLGTQLTGTITQISSFPSQNYYGTMGQENPNSSYYQFTVIIDTQEVLTIGDWVEIYFSPTDGSGMGSSDTLYLPMAFVREDSGGSYVMKLGEDGRLAKQYVRTGKSIYGYAIEIKAGVSLSDSIAFPYGKQVKEGAPTVEAEGYYY